MGPYCRYCNQRCFTHFPMATPQIALDAYGSVSIIATCPAGQRFEKGRTGWCYDDIMRQIDIDAGIAPTGPDAPDVASESDLELSQPADRDPGNPFAA